MKLIGFVCPRLHNYVVEENKCVRKLDTNDPLWHTVIWHSFCICLNSISCFYHCPILLSVRTQFRTIIVDSLALMDKIQLLYVSIVSMSERKFIKICFVTVCYRVYIVFPSLTLQSVTKTFSWHLDLQFYYCCCWRCCCDLDVLDDNEHYLFVSYQVQPEIVPVWQMVVKWMMHVGHGLLYKTYCLHNRRQTK